MRIAVISDIHGNLRALEAVVKDIERRGADVVVNLGDSLSGPLLPRETARFLMSQKTWLHLAGNHERQILSLTGSSGESDKYAHSQLSEMELQWLASLSPVHQFSAEVLLCHGTPTSDCTGLLQTAERNATRAEIEARLGDVDVPVILCGHTHVPRIVHARSATLIVNPGSVGHPAFADDHPYPHVVESGSPDARYAIVEKQPAGWSASLHSVPYAHHEMAALATSRQRPDWESALLRGYMS
jgi:putative phosphoesterase